MTSAARIEELQKKFDENPRRYFAPLANECRKAGDLDAAIAICRAHLPQQPGHMSGHIVYGQALYESGETAEAKAVFETALGLDPENLIALRHMGDIAARTGDVGEARQWYMRVLETDPRNEEIQALVAGLEGSRPASSGSDAASKSSEVDAQTLEGLPSLLDPALMAAAAEAGTAEETPPSAAPDDLLMPTAYGESAAADGKETIDSILDGFEATSFDTPSPDPAAAYPVEMEPSAPDAHAGDDPSWDVPGADEPSWQEGTADEPRFTSDARSTDDTLAAPTFDSEPADNSPLQDPPENVAPPDAFVTETMAELYLRQGYAEQALAVYRQLVAQNPHDDALRDRMQHAERAAGIVDGATAPGLPQDLEPALLAAAADADPGRDEGAFSPHQPVAASASGTSGPTIREFLAALALGQRTAGGAVPVHGSGMPVAEDVPQNDAATAGQVEHVSGMAPSGNMDQEGEMSSSGEMTPFREEMPAGEMTPTGEIATVVDVADSLESTDRIPGLGLDPVEDYGGEGRSGSAGNFETSISPGSAASGEQGLDRLFGAPADDADVRAADAFAKAFGSAPEAPVAPDHEAPAADPLSGRPARPAGNDLSLDSVFGAPRQASPNRPTGGFSFDQFFSDGSVKSPREEPQEAAPPADDDEDLEQFNSWLHGLKKQ